MASGHNQASVKLLSSAADSNQIKIKEITKHLNNLHKKPDELGDDDRSSQKSQHSEGAVSSDGFTPDTLNDNEEQSTFDASMTSHASSSQKKSNKAAKMKKRRGTLIDRSKHTSGKFSIDVTQSMKGRQSLNAIEKSLNKALKPSA